LIRGNVQIVADERTNILLIVSRPENDAFFAEMIAALDKKVDPEITVRIFNLQFAEAENVSETLNELIGAATGDTNRPNVQTDAPEGGNRSGQTLREFIRQRNNGNEAPQADRLAEGGDGIGRLSENTRILADARTNSLILMGRNGDLDVLEGVVRQLDIMLAQVAVRAVIMEVNLNDNLSYGIDWLQRSLTVNDVTTVNGVKIREPVAAFGGGQNLSPNSTAFRDGADVGRDIQLSPGSLSYFTTLYDYNLDAVLRLAQGSSDAKVIATPIIVTTDNTEASIVVGERRAIPTTTATTIGGSVQSAFEYENIGLDLTVTPRINPQGVVIMEVTQSAENVGGSTIIDGNEVPIITTRQLEASVAIRSGGTLALGGLVREDKRDSETKVPILGSIPILGHLFRSTSSENVRTELLVLLSPEVLVTAEEAEKLTRELKAATELGDASWYRGWEEGAKGLSEPPEE
jgi:general secretion pathway protein D